VSGLDALPVFVDADTHVVAALAVDGDVHPRTNLALGTKCPQTLSNGRCDEAGVGIGRLHLDRDVLGGAAAVVHANVERKFRAFATDRSGGDARFLEGEPARTHVVVGPLGDRTRDQQGDPCGGHDEQERDCSEQLFSIHGLLTVAGR
jgi:hypothetical protein